MEYPLVTACIDLDAVGKNIRNLRSMIDQSCRFMAVVKADGYGHGAVRIAEKALLSGAGLLGVARLNEAIELREAGIRAPILVFGYIHPLQAAQASDLDITITVYGFEQATQVSCRAVSLRKPLKVHLKTDTGMGRVGMIIEKNPGDKEARKKTVQDIRKIAGLPGLDLQGIYTHFAAADSKDKTYTLLQIELFDALLSDLKSAGIDIEIRHASNSAGIIEFPQANYDMVRAGISLYGLYPSRDADRSRVTLFPAMTLKSVVTSVRKVPKGFFVSYGMTHETQKETVLASVPIGYADGFSRQFSSNGRMLVKGRQAPVVGRVCMDQTLIDVGHIPGVGAGDEVVLMGSQGNDHISADDLAERVKTINYEIVSALTSRVMRLYSD
ncbi:MAG: alanine racemase [Desulfobacula sp. GWF2_41_7]|nr:MAG: alanine racemase [Desulfobacula sp. GWF2_41_7]